MKRIAVILGSVSVTVAIARAQPAPDNPTPPLPPENPGSGTEQPPPTSGSGTPTAGSGDNRTPAEPYAPLPPPKPKKPRGPFYMPEVLTIPTGSLLPAAVLYSRTSVDTGGGVSSDTRVGLGDVAEFGVATTDSVRERQNDEDVRPQRIQPYVTASFRLGVGEEKLFSGQPGVTLGFRKSFERNHNDFKTRIAELTLVATKHIADKAAFHIGGAFWDASLEGDVDSSGTRREVSLHAGNNFREQIRIFGGLEVTPLEHSSILVDVGWAPQFCYHCTQDTNKIVLKPVLSWGVRYEVARWMRLEAGVRVPDIGDANLLDAQIFGQLTFTSWALHDAVESLK
jgi:hypothetical protein